MDSFTLDNLKKPQLDFELKGSKNFDFVCRRRAFTAAIKVSQAELEGRGVTAE